MQSNYLPWRGYFDLMAHCDVFVVYDSRQYTVNDWRNRNRIKTSNGDRVAHRAGSHQGPNRAIDQRGRGRRPRLGPQAPVVPCPVARPGAPRTLGPRPARSGLRARPRLPGRSTRSTSIFSRPSMTCSVLTVPTHDDSTFLEPRDGGAVAERAGRRTGPGRRGHPLPDRSVRPRLPRGQRLRGQGHRDRGPRLLHAR